MKDILFFGGSNNPKSINHALVCSVANMIGAERTTVVNLADFEQPMYSIARQQQGIPEEAIALKILINDHTTIILSVAEHNGSITAFLKNTLDWLSRVSVDYKVFANKQVVLFAASPGGGQSAIAHAETILKRMGATITGKAVANNFHQRTRFTDKGLEIIDANLQNEINTIINTLIN